jgi:hypothetical protein
LFFNINSFYSAYKGQSTDYHVDINVFSFNVYAQQTFKLAKTTTAEVSGYYTAPSIYQGAFEARGLGTVDLGIQQAIFKGKGTLKASVTDVFRTLQWKATNSSTGQTIKVNGGMDSRQFRINFNYRFGSSQVKAARNRKSAAEEENKRTQESGGLGGQ